MTVKKRSLGWVRDVLTRSIRLEQRQSQTHVVLVDPRRRESGNEAGEPPTLLMEQRADLGARLLVHDPSTQIVRKLFVVHDALRNAGWEGVAALAPPVVECALVEAEILASQEPTPVLATIIASLRELAEKARARAVDLQLEHELERPQSPEVSETNYEEFELMERSWMGTVPAGLELPGRTI